MELSNTARRGVVGAVMALAVAASIGLVAGCQRKPETLKIGVGQPLSGNLKTLGQDMLNGAQMAADE
ncbi:MAG TPA: branched-chain amino acid ABC transporter substrate-binding protein, partial [Albitalea sp.]|nr:branched-chain amino acid ABC transporter substrate-binding protein [Albitalea sp.]